jgi:hypothetical protein
MCILYYSYLYHCFSDLYYYLYAVHVDSLFSGVDQVLSREQYYPYYMIFLYLIICLTIPVAGHIQSRCIRFRIIFYLFHRFTSVTFVTLLLNHFYPGLHYISILSSELTLAENYI